MIAVLARFQQVRPMTGYWHGFSLSEEMQARVM
jgi:hypothetical protein